MIRRSTLRALRNSLFAAVFLSAVWLADAHEVPRTRIIVDTDIALDDVRALILLTQLPDVDLVAVLTSDGACSPRVAARNAVRVLGHLGMRDVPVGVGRVMDKPAPPWREMSEALGWADLPGSGTEAQLPDARALLRTLLRGSHEKIIYICLGPLSNLAAVLRSDRNLAKSIERIHYRGSPPGVEPVSWNTNRDPEAAHEVFSAGIETYAIHLGNSQDLCFDNVFYADIERLSSPAAELVTQLHKSRHVRQLIDEKHFRCWDEAAVLALAVPSLIHLERMQRYPSAYVVSSWDQAAARRGYLDLLSGIHSKTPIPRAAVLLDHYPTDSLLLQKDVAARAVEIIHRHGLEEWKSALLASELHRHLGVYSILGVKMGIRAREILEASPDELRVESWAGFEPPLSCMNDGLQVSTGATLGRGTISVATDRSEPKALFVKGSKRLELDLREEVTARIRRDVRDALKSHGNLTPAYWARIRELALDYWLELDRREIFRETLTQQETSR